MGGPRFRVLDVVEIGYHPTLARQGLVGVRGAIMEIRQHADGRVRYAVGGLRDATSEVGGLYEEEDLQATGVRADAETYQLPGPFQVRDVVRISAACDQAEIAGRTGVVDGGYTGSNEIGHVLGVWIEELGEGFMVEPAFLSASGTRLPPPERGRVAHSTRVSEHGEVIGHTSYIIVDELEQYL
jgi:hypothetical protein